MQSLLRYAALASALALVSMCGLQPAKFGGGVAAQQPNVQRPRRVTKAEPTAPPSAAIACNGRGRRGRCGARGNAVGLGPGCVTNSAGRPLPGLRAENFVLFENGQQQKIANFATTEAPFEIALLLDTSGSTRWMSALFARLPTLSSMRCARATASRLLASTRETGAKRCGEG